MVGSNLLSHEPNEMESKKVKGAELFSLSYMDQAR